MAGGRKSPGAAGVVLASGAGTRVGAATNKVYLPLAGRSVVSWSLEAFSRVEGIDVLVLVTRPVDSDLVEHVLREELAGIPVETVHGGRTRQESELFALRHLESRIESGAVDAVLLHDGARPLVSTALIAEVLRVTREHGAALPGLVADDIVALEGTGGETVTGTDTATLVRAQTPQGFRAAPLLAAYEQAEAESFAGTDTASCMERFSELPVRWVRGEERNIKVTYPHDLVIAEQVLAGGG
ncbi:2-C-methyl-D-erythritol 4-phosphate cytidylyltransferase [Saccharomonospora xinjiangensis]|uniref:IspD/TarI family cytidylyltransferase n=1 Tax=Saccharomonospora xinjiangensis TaxID=75294 RepID=UPI0035102650